MCDRQYYDDDIGQLCCPDQPICEECWCYLRTERRKETDMALEAHILQLQEQGTIPKFRKARPECPVVPAPQPLPPGVVSVYELTLTTPEDDPYYLRESFQKIVSSAMYEVHSFEACIELTKEGLPHIHAVLYSKNKYCDASKLKTKFKYRAELKRVRKIDNYLNYIKKEDGNPIIVDYCAKKGIPQFWTNDIHEQKV